MEQINRIIDYELVIWPENNITQKDINDMVLAGVDDINIMDTINNNKFSGFDS